MKLNVTQKLFMTLALCLLASTAAWADYKGYTKNYVSADGLVFQRQFTAEDPTGSTCVLIKPSADNKEVWALCNDYGQAIGYADPGGNPSEKHVGPDGDEYTGSTYEIPSAPGGYDLVSIDSYAFKGNTHLKSITFPAANLTSVPDNSFQGCTALKTLNFSGSSIKVIGTAAFAQCTALEAIEDWGHVETIHGCSVGFGYGSFGGCTALTELKFSPSVKYIYGNAFGGCTGVKKLIFEDGNDLLELSPGDGNEGSAALMFYDSPITYVYYGRKMSNNAPDNYIQFINPLSTLSVDALNAITRMDVEFSEKIDTIRSTFFREMTMPLYIKAPAVTYIGTYAFQQANVKSLDVPKIKHIDKNAFENSTISDLNFYSVEEIGNKAFYGARLVNVSLPATLKYIGVNAFNVNYTSDVVNESGNYDQVSSLKTFRIEDGDEPIELGFDTDEYEKLKDADYDWEPFVYSLEWLASQSLEELYIGRPVGHEPFINEFGSTNYYASALQFKAITFPQLKKVELTKVKTVSSFAFGASDSEFEPASSLEEVSLPMLKAVPSQCFFNCGKLTTVNIPKAETLWNEAFAYTSGDLDISFINTVDSIKQRCFANSGVSGELTIPGSVKYLGKDVFYNCENLKKLTFEYSEKPLEMEYFIAGNYATSGVMSIGGEKCGIEEFYFDRNVKPSTYTDGNGDTYTYRFEIAIGDGLYGSRGFPNLKSVTIGKKITSLDGYTFVSTGLEFIRCENLEPIALEYTTSEDDDSYNADHSQGPSFTSTVQEEVKILVPDGSVSDYLAADVWKGFMNLTDSKGDLGTIAITVPANGYTTYSGLRNLDFSKLTDIKVYIVTSYDADVETVELSPVTAVSALQYDETGVVIKGKPGTYQVPVVETKSAYLNMLTGVPSSKITLAKEGYTYYNYSSRATDVFNCYLKDGDFIKSNGAVKVGPNAAYLQIQKDFNTRLEDSEPVTVDVTLGKNSLTPFSPDVDLNFTDVQGLEAYCVTGFINTGTVLLTRVYKVPAYTAVLLKGTPEATYTVPSKVMKSVCMNMLQVNGGDTDMTIEEKTYSLANYYLDGDKFKKVKTSVTIAPGEVYLNVPITVVAADGPDELAVVLQETETMNILSSLELEPVTISSAKQVTYMSDKDLDFTGYLDLKAYVATGYDKASGTIWLTRVKEVPANTGFLLMGEADTYEIPVKAGGLSSYYQNMFKGTLEGMTIQTTDGEYTNYYLSDGESGVGFYKVTKPEGITLGKNRAYLPIPTEIPAVGTAGSTETIKVSSAGQVPYYNTESLDFSSLDAQGVKAYTATGYDYNSGTIWLTRVKHVPAKTGILIMAPEGEYPVPTASVSSVYANMFRGTLEGTTIQTHEEIDGKDYINYYLSSGASGVGFYRVTKEGGVTIKANRCYLPILNKDAAAGTRSAKSDLNQINFEESDEVIGIPLFRGIGGDDDGTTGVKEVKSGEGKGEKWFTLQGQRVAKPGKGLYIKNGKKVIVR